MSNGTPFDGLPTWAKTIALVGFPAVITLFLLAQSAGWIPSEVRAMAHTLAAQQSAVEEHVKTTNDLAASIRLAARIMCENAATAEQQHRRCEQIR